MDRSMRKSIHSKYLLAIFTLWCKVICMFTRSEAEENLRTIRSLMERSTIYRAISAPTALVGGLASIAACSYLLLRFGAVPPDGGTYEDCFTVTWLCVLVLTIVANTWFIWRGAKERSEPFISAGMKLALISLLPSMLCGGYFTLFLAPDVQLCGIWMICYGVGLLSTSHFAPRSITFLGWVFLISGFCTWYPMFWAGPAMLACTNLLMGATFGLYHLIYAACTWPRKSNSTISGDEP